MIQTETQTQTETSTTIIQITPTTSAEESSSDVPWGWIVLGAALLLALVAGVVISRRHRAADAASTASVEDFRSRCFLALDAVLARGSVVTGQIDALAAEARSLEARTSGEPARSEAGRLRASLEGLAGALESDRTLRLSSPPPSGDQLSYSTAVIRQHVEQVQAVLRPPPAPPSRRPFQ